MIDDLLNKISEVVKEEGSQDGSGKGNQSAAINISVGDIINNQGTVVIGGNLNQGQRREDRDSAEGPCASSHEVRTEMHALRDQLTRLKRHLTDLYDTCLKHCPHCQSQCRNPYGKTLPPADSVSNYHFPPRVTQTWLTH